MGEVNEPQPACQPPATRRLNFFTVQQNVGNVTQSGEEARLMAEKRSLMADVTKTTLALAASRSSSEKDGIYTVEG